MAVFGLVVKALTVGEDSRTGGLTWISVSASRIPTVHLGSSSTNKVGSKLISQIGKNVCTLPIFMVRVTYSLSQIGIRAPFQTTRTLFINSAWICSAFNSCSEREFQ